jgi:bifunctional UDP-N-acetylglucosamine pyrophosphorylase/glucosamine-1-phosphate N-acetyltransferase
MTGLWAVILAAGEGKRMRSARAKLLHELAGRPLVHYPVDLARAVGAAGTVVVTGHQGQAVRAVLADAPHLRFATQPAPRGTGDALAVARGMIPATARAILVLSGDVPLLSPDTVATLLARHRATRAAATLLTFTPPDPTGYGRIIRAGGSRGRVRAIVEERDATAAQRRVREANAGVYCFSPRRLWPALDRITPENDQGELYLTDVIARLVRAGLLVEAVPVTDPLEVAGVNDRRQLAELEAVVRGLTAARLMAEGVTVCDPATTYADVSVTVGRDTILEPGVRLAGRTVIGEGCRIGAGCQLTDVTLGARVTLRPYCVLDGSVVTAGATLGPFARVARGRPRRPRPSPGGASRVTRPGAPGLPPGNRPSLGLRSPGSAPPTRAFRRRAGARGTRVASVPTRSRLSPRGG